MYENKEICSNCKDVCCKHIPGCCHPSDFSNNINKMKKALLSKYYCIDWWESDPRKNKNEYHEGYFIRPATKNKVGILRDPSWGGECVFLSDTGCKLSSDKRPMMCRMLEPVENNKCVLHGKDKREYCIDWLKYHEFLDNF